ncbi:hypothetical protein [Streptomyces sp. NBC_00525]|uniref:hypothetical protein n=1 Tax=Streptomyces sp. NBC_00525 TaxID=2903660 RepID=UPI002E819389|nr:hypothetical protein [Streptomyces sp. NBC_00525]WUC97402.1 hypothetical protein OG710_28975 [Streptomyces sp. NBC_00525]
MHSTKKIVVGVMISLAAIFGMTACGDGDAPAATSSAPAKASPTPAQSAVERPPAKDTAPAPAAPQAAVQDTPAPGEEWNPAWDGCLNRFMAELEHPTGSQETPPECDGLSDARVQAIGDQAYRMFLGAQGWEVTN